MKVLPFILPLLTAGALGTVHFMPEPNQMSPSAVEMEIAGELGPWITRAIPVTELELAILSKDTEFSKAICLSPREGEFDIATGDAIPDRVDLSIVLSGHDLNNSIHRPERCMPSQGHVIGSSDHVEIKLPNGRKIDTRRLLSVQTLPTDETHTKHVSFDCVTYYFFVGNHTITHDHIERTLIDVKDRLLRGMDQRWAYVSASMWYGKVPWIEEEITREEAEEKLRKFLTDFALNQIDWSMITN